jgi:hypothetical protein
MYGHVVFDLTPLERGNGVQLRTKLWWNGSEGIHPGH